MADNHSTSVPPIRYAIVGIVGGAGIFLLAFTIWWIRRNSLVGYPHSEEATSPIAIDQSHVLRNFAPRKEEGTRRDSFGGISTTSSSPITVDERKGSIRSGEDVV
ncbi:hypothetical protein JCM5353_000022 [Sporobolomyces roseus]